MRAREALQTFRRAKSEDGERTVLDWVEERSAFATTEIAFEGLPANTVMTVVAIIPGRVELPASMAEAKDIEGNVTHLIFSDTPSTMSLEDYPVGTYSVCVEARVGDEPRAFGCDVIEHSAERTEPFVITFRALDL